MKILLIINFLVVALFSNTYSFHEKRYSYVFDDSIVLDGIITFDVNNIFIKYNNSDKEIFYEDSIITLKENAKVVELSVLQTQQIKIFLDILVLLNENNEIILNNKFDITTINEKIVLVPKYELYKHIEKIIVTRDGNKLEVIQVTLLNHDTITISIDHEIH